MKWAVTWLFVLLLLPLAGCHGGGDASADSKKGEKKEEAKSDKGILKLDAAAQQRAGLQFASVTRRAVESQLEASGRITINEEQTAHVGTVTDGRITELLARVGDPVRRGQVLGRFHSHDVHESRASYETALADLQRQKSSLAYAQRQRDRFRRLYEIKSASLQEVEQSEANLRGAQTDLENAQIAVEKERSHIAEFLQIPLGPDGRLSEEQEEVPIKSPISGVVIARPVTIGSVVTAGTEAFTVADLSSVWMIASVNETDLGKLRVGLPAQVRVQAYPSTTFRGRLAYLGKELDPATRTLQVRVLVPNTGQQLRAEMYARAEFPQTQTREAVFLPEGALQDMNGNTVVFIRRNGNEFEPRPVELGRREAGEVEVVAGVKPGEQVAVKGGFLLKSQMLKGTLESE